MTATWPDLIARAFLIVGVGWFYAAQLYRLARHHIIITPHERKPTMTATMTDAERQLWRDAVLISWIGASNPRAVQRTLDQHARHFGDHPAVRAIRGHLDFLLGRSLGPEDADLAAVKAHVGEVIA